MTKQLFDFNHYVVPGQVSVCSEKADCTQTFSNFNRVAEILYDFEQ